MKRPGLLVGVFVLPSSPSCLVPEKNHTEISVSYKADWPIRSSLLLANSHILINPFNQEGKKEARKDGRRRQVCDMTEVWINGGVFA